MADFRPISISTSRIGQVESCSLQVEVDYMFFCEICLVHIRTQVVFEMFSGCWGVRRVMLFSDLLAGIFPIFIPGYFLGWSHQTVTNSSWETPLPQCVRHQHFFAGIPLRYSMDQLICYLLRVWNICVVLQIVRFVDCWCLFHKRLYWIIYRASSPFGMIKVY